MKIRLSMRPLFLAAMLAAQCVGVRATHGEPACPGDLNTDGSVTINEILRAVDTALGGCGVGCGDGVLQPELGEVCDRDDLGGASCASLGFGSGALACTATCEFKTLGCTGSGGMLKTGQTHCDLGSGTLGTCPGTPPGQDGAVQAGAAISYTDNGNGTIRDNATGLTWEKLSDDQTIHDWNDTYSWYDAFRLKIAALNTPPCFAGHCDWRLPNRRELESLVDAGRWAPAIGPAFATGCAPGCTVTTCSCTQLDYYWSSTSYRDASLPGFAWAVTFNDGIVNAFEKTDSEFGYVRAVRGGS